MPSRKGLDSRDDLRDVDALFTNYMGEEGSVQMGVSGDPPALCRIFRHGRCFLPNFRASHAGDKFRSLRGCADRLRLRQRSVEAAAEPRPPPRSTLRQFEAPMDPLSHRPLRSAPRATCINTERRRSSRGAAVAARQWAGAIPRPGSRAAVDEVMASQSAIPCASSALVTDGGGGVSPAGKARRQKPCVLGAGESHTHGMLRNRPISP